VVGLVGYYKRLPLDYGEIRELFPETIFLSAFVVPACRGFSCASKCLLAMVNTLLLDADTMATCQFIGAAVHPQNYTPQAMLASFGMLRVGDEKVYTSKFGPRICFAVKKEDIGRLHMIRSQEVYREGIRTISVESFRRLDIDELHSRADQHRRSHPMTIEEIECFAPPHIIAKIRALTCVWLLHRRLRITAFGDVPQEIFDLILGWLATACL